MVPIENLFPRPVGTYKLDRELSGEEISFIKNQDRRPNISNTTSTDNFILCHETMTNIRDFIESKLNEFFTTVYNPKHKVNLKITQSWCNYTEPGQHHHRHAHANSFVSGVFYPQATKETDKIHFYRAGFEQIKLPPQEWNMWNSESWWFPVGTGDLILFPSGIDHMVEVVGGEQTRISLSFNTFLVGQIGDDSELTGLQIGESDGALRIS
jgi:uncharacterized protein (TIGR02466 family)